MSDTACSINTIGFHKRSRETSDVSEAISGAGMAMQRTVMIDRI